jgi:hypothetical protein
MPATSDSASSRSPRHASGMLLRCSKLPALGGTHCVWQPVAGGVRRGRHRLAHTALHSCMVTRSTAFDAASHVVRTARAHHRHHDSAPAGPTWMRHFFSRSSSYSTYLQRQQHTRQGECGAGRHRVARHHASTHLPCLTRVVSGTRAASPAAWQPQPHSQDGCRDAQLLLQVKQVLLPRRTSALHHNHRRMQGRLRRRA